MTRALPIEDFASSHGHHGRRVSFSAWRGVVAAVVILWAYTAAPAEERFPTPEFQSGYQMPTMQVTPARWRGWNVVDTVALAGWLSLGAYVVYRRRSRTATFVLMVAALAYFGFYRRGCVCPIGATGNVAMALGPNGYALPWTVAAFFVLPLLFALFFGRVFCGTSCPLGAIQDVMLWRPLRLPLWLERALGLFAFLYLGLAVMLAAVGTDLIICRYDPFVGLFRLSGPAHMIVLGFAFLLVCMFIGRAYCRFICPYGALLRLLSMLSWKRVTITPSECVDCRMCEEGCPFNCIRRPTASQPLRPEEKRRARRVLVRVLAAQPVLIAAFAVLGALAAPGWASLDRRIDLARQVLAEQATGRKALTDETSVFWKSGMTVGELLTQTEAVKRRFRIGSTIFGAWTGLVLGMGLLGASVRRYRIGWTADAGTCLACSRCYLTCPVEHSRRTGQSVESILQTRQAVA